MKYLLILVMLIASPAWAEWTVSDISDEFIVYVDRATIRRNGNLVKMWSLKDYTTVEKKSASGDSYLSSKEQDEYDCKEEKIRILAFTWFSGQMGNGKVVVSYSDPDKWDPIQPGSIGETLWKIACGKR